MENPLYRSQVKNFICVKADHLIPDCYSVRGQKNSHLLQRTHFGDKLKHLTCYFCVVCHCIHLQVMFFSNNFTTHPRLLNILTLSNLFKCNSDFSSFPKINWRNRPRLKTLANMFDK
jgi:hypothetical protein